MGKRKGARWGVGCACIAHRPEIASRSTSAGGASMYSPLGLMYQVLKQHGSRYKNHVVGSRPTWRPHNQFGSVMLPECKLSTLSWGPGMVFEQSFSPGPTDLTSERTVRPKLGHSHTFGPFTAQFTATAGSKTEVTIAMGHDVLVNVKWTPTPRAQNHQQWPPGRQLLHFCLLHCPTTPR